jgi:sterol desaturase/sphingolipid hydroxylase (fatty acid hydroxylase superfamily)/creatinine amidohydrolase/Fe(II)-dependent formamide hydrolase-like protein
LLDHFSLQTLRQWLAITAPEERIYWLYLATSLMMAFGCWAHYRYGVRSDSPESTQRRALAFIFDRRVWLHRSALQDYLYFLLNGAVYVGLISQLLISTHFFIVLFYSGLEQLCGVPSSPLLPSGYWVPIAYTLVYALLIDFAIFITHYLQHKIPVLWEFHKVHHSAEVLTPVTLYRMHPVDMVFSGIVASMLAGLAFAGFWYLTGQVPATYEIMGLNILVFAFYLVGYNLRHSHIWLSYPRWLSHVLISPAQHQIHHSTAPQHFDKNMGLIFAFWDRMFGSLYVPSGYEKIQYGLSEQEPNPFASVWAMYLQPFREVWRMIRPGRFTARATVAALVVMGIIANYTFFYAVDRGSGVTATPRSVHLEELTWTEVSEALRGGYRTVIIPTGGTEQNGPHLVLGKHNYVVRHTGEQIARRLGDALVAPVIAYVPEEQHMGFAGTVSLPEDLFERLLEAAAESYARHGFEQILLIGDSYGNQPGQQRVAERLSERWQPLSIRVWHIGDYYAGNGQFDWLTQLGFAAEQIGGHAGIRDTSELLVTRPQGVRRLTNQPRGAGTGYDGDPSLATLQLGQRLLELKIEAAVDQILRFRGELADRR